jgi:hypothetical protein
MIIQLMLFTSSTYAEVGADTKRLRQHSDVDLNQVNDDRIRRAQALTTVGRINRVEIIDARSDKVIKTLMNNTDIVLSEFQLTSVGQLNFMAVPSKSGTIKSMLFRTESNVGISNKNSTITDRIDNSSPYAACGNSGGDFFVCFQRLSLGRNILTVVPYTRSGGLGIAGIPLVLSFTIVRNTPRCSIPKVKQTSQI